MKHLLYLLLFFTCNVLAQERLNLHQCIEIARQSSFSVKQNRLDLLISEENILLQRHSRYPSLQIRGNGSWNFGRQIDPTTNEFVTQDFANNSWTLSSGVTLYDGGRIGKEVARARLDNRASELLLEDEEDNVALSVTEAYLSILLAHESVSLSDTLLTNARRRFERTETLIRTGSRPAAELLDIEAEVAELESRLIENQNNLELAKLQLKILMNYEPGKELEIVKPQLPEPPEELRLADPESIYHTAVENQPTILRNDLMVDYMNLGIEIANTGFYPTINLFGSLGTNYSTLGRNFKGSQPVTVIENVVINGEPAIIEQELNIPLYEEGSYLDQLEENLGIATGVSLIVPIYSNYQNKYNQQVAILNKESAELNLRQAKLELRNTITQAYAAAVASWRKYKAAEAVLAARGESLGAAEKRFEIGALSTYDLITVREALEEARIALLNAKYEYHFRTRVLDFYMGKPITL